MTEGTDNVKRFYLREWLDHRGLIAARISDRLDVAPALVSRWVNGRCRPTQRHLGPLAATLGVEPQDLYHHPSEFALADAWRALDPEQRERAKAILIYQMGSDAEIAAFEDEKYRTRREAEKRAEPAEDHPPTDLTGLLVLRGRLENKLKSVNRAIDTTSRKRAARTTARR